MGMLIAHNHNYVNMLCAYFVSFFHFFRYDSFQEHGQVAAFDMTIFRPSVGQGETAPLQAFIPEGQAIPVPVQELYHAAATIDEDEERSRQRIRRQIGTDDTAQAVEGLAHIA